MPGRFPMLREAALALFLIAVALGLWLADVRPLAVVGVMALALAVAWVIEWVSWREDQLHGMPPVLQEVRTSEVAVEPAAVAPEPVPVAPEPAAFPEPAPAPASRARGLWLRRPKRAKTSEPAPAEASAGLGPEVGQEEARAEPPEEVGKEEVGAEQPEGVGAGRAPPGRAVTPESEGRAGPEPEGPTGQAPAPPEPPPSKRRLKPVQSAPPPAPAPPEPEPSLPPPEPEPQGAPVVPLWARSSQPREWNLWDLERIARAQSRRDPQKFEEWSYLFLHLRRFASADGMLPAEFDGLVRDYFGSLLEPAQGA